MPKKGTSQKEAATPYARPQSTATSSARTTTAGAPDSSTLPTLELLFERLGLLSDETLTKLARDLGSEFSVTVLRQICTSARNNDTALAASSPTGGSAKSLTIQPPASSVSASAATLDDKAQLDKRVDRFGHVMVAGQANYTPFAHKFQTRGICGNPECAAVNPNPIPLTMGDDGRGRCYQCVPFYNKYRQDRTRAIPRKR